MTINSGTCLSHYQILSRIGAGGMGEVYLAQDTKLDRKVALKILPAIIYAGLNDKDQAFEWFNKSLEARSVLALWKVEIAFDNLRPDPRFKDMLRRLNLPE